MKAFINTPITKERFLHHLKWHQDQDRILAGTYEDDSEGFRGCAVGCSLNSVRVELGEKISVSNHSLYEKYFGVPEWLARVEDTIFEGLNIERQKLWPFQFGEAINIGSDLGKIKHPFLIFIMDQNLKTLNSLQVNKDKYLDIYNSIERTKKAIQLTIEYHKNPTRNAAESAAASAKSAKSAAESARNAAWSAAWSAESARNAAESAAASAESAAWSARNAAESAAWSARNAAASAAESAWNAESARNAAESAWNAKSAAYEKYADKLLELMRECKR